MRHLNGHRIRPIRSEFVFTWPLLVLLAGLPGCTRTPPPSLLGKWQDTHSQSFTFLPDGGLEYHKVLSDDRPIWSLGSYTDSHGVLNLSMRPPPGAGPGLPEKVPYHFDGEVLILNLGAPQDFKSTPVTLTPLRSALQGIWKGTGDPSRDAFVGIVFTPDSEYFIGASSGDFADQVGHPVETPKIDRVGLYELAPTLLMEQTVLNTGVIARRTREFDVAGDDLRVTEGNQTEGVYQRVHGPMPFTSSGLDAQAWNALK